MGDPLRSSRLWVVAVTPAIFLMSCVGSIDSDPRLGPFTDPVSERSPGGSVGGPTGQGGEGARGSNDRPGDSKSPGGSAPGGTGTLESSSAGPRPLRRLTRREYDNTVRDLLGDRTAPAKNFPSDRDGFVFRSPGVVSQLEADRYREAAEVLAATALKNLDQILPCRPAETGEAACARSFVEVFGRRAYRRPLWPAEIDALAALYQKGRATLALGFSDAIGLLIEAMLQSPGFLYRAEMGPAEPVKEGPLVRLGPYELASRLSYFLWSSMPDPELFEAAAANKLLTPAQIDSQARRLLKDPKASDGVTDFIEELLDLERLGGRTKDLTIYGEFTEELKAAMTAETRAFASHVLLQADGRLETLLAASFSFINEPLAKLYGLEGIQGSELRKADLPSAQRSGLLTNGSFLAETGATNSSDPVARGVRIFERFLCRHAPEPPADVPAPRPPSTGGTTRERFADHARQECATACHGLFDPFGFAFEHYDGIGRFRTLDNGRPVDASGAVQLDGVLRPFADARGLTQLLAQSDEARRCFATQWLRFAFRRPETGAEASSIDDAIAAAARSQFDIRELIVALTTTPSFRYRTLNPGEAMP